MNAKQARAAERWYDSAEKMGRAAAARCRTACLKRRQQWWLRSGAAEQNKPATQARCVRVRIMNALRARRNAL